MPLTIVADVVVGREYEDDEGNHGEGVDRQKHHQQLLQVVPEANVG